MQINNNGNKLVTTKFIKAKSLSLLEEEMTRKILTSGKILDFYAFFQINLGARGTHIVAAYRDEIGTGVEEALRRRTVKDASE